MKTNPNPHLWLICVPTESSSEATFEKLNARLVSKQLADPHVFQIPKNLKVGTLDALMKLSDSLTSSDSELEQLVKRIQKAYHDLLEDEALLNSSGAPPEAKEAVSAPPSLNVFDDSLLNYVKKFKWDLARYPNTTDLFSLSEAITQVGIFRFLNF